MYLVGSYYTKVCLLVYHKNIKYSLMHEHGTHTGNSHSDANNFIVTAMHTWHTSHFHIVTIEAEVLVALWRQGTV